jgi:hypothetical protein
VLFSRRVNADEVFRERSYVRLRDSTVSTEDRVRALRPTHVHVGFHRAVCRKPATIAVFAAVAQLAM